MKNKNKKILAVVMTTAILLGGASLAYAQAGNGMGQGGSGNGGGCRGDQTCIAERQAKMKAENPDYIHQEKSQNGKMNGDKKECNHKDKEANMQKQLDEIKNSPGLDLSDRDKEILTFMWEEEKLARDVYITMDEKWGVKPFSNIIKSETRHMEMVEVLVNKYNLNSKIDKTNEVGEFNDFNLQKLYNDLVEKGQKSEIDALQVGMTVEDVDIYDLERMMAETKNQDIIDIFTKLRNASYNHMKAFDKKLKAAGGSYEAQYISQERMKEILQMEKTNQHTYSDKSIAVDESEMEDKRLNDNNTFWSKIMNMFFFWI